MPLLPYVCLNCHRVYKRVEVDRLVRLGEHESGYCEECKPLMESKWFGPKVQDVEAMR